jgi:hypothetical protein
MVACIEFLHSFLKEAGTVYDIINQSINKNQKAISYTLLIQSIRVVGVGRNGGFGGRGLMDAERKGTQVCARPRGVWIIWSCRTERW